MLRLLLFVVIAGSVYLWWHHPHRFPKDFWRRWLVPGVVSFLALLYAVSPIDLIPDVTPLGYVDDLIVLATTFWWVRKRLEQTRPNRPDDRSRRSTSANGRTRWDPYAVLGVRRGASREEVTRAYREQMKLYHPDRVNELGEELQRVAHQKTLDIQRAYKEVMGDQ